MKERLSQFCRHEERLVGGGRTRSPEISGQSDPVGAKTPISLDNRS